MPDGFSVLRNHKIQNANMFAVIQRVDVFYLLFFFHIKYNEAMCLAFIAT